MYGADWIKVIVNVGARILSAEELHAIVDEAGRAGKRVAAHATDGDRAAWLAAEAGVASIEHAYTVSDTVLRLMASKGIVLVPTLIAGVYGMNFDHMPELHWRLGYVYALALMGGSALVLWVRFKRAGWL